MNRFILFRSASCILRRSMCSPAAPTPSPPPSTATTSSSNLPPKFRPTDLQRFILVWTKKYKTKADIPDFVSPELIDRARSEARIKLSNILMLLTALASLGAIFAGKAAAKRGETVVKMNQDWHKQYREDYDKKQAALDK